MSELHMPFDGLVIRGRVIITVRDERGRVIDEQVHTNTVTNWTRALIASFLAGDTINIGSGASVQPSLPAYIALGTGTGTPAVTDQAMFAETYNTRKQYAFRDVLQGYYAQTVVNYSSSDPNGTYTELGLWDQPTQSVTLAANVSAGATSIMLSGNTPQMYQGQQIYISDGANSEYATLAHGANAGATTWTLKSGLQYAHSSGVTVVAFGGNLLAHVVLSGSGIQITTGQTVTVQWQIYCQAG